MQLRASLVTAALLCTSTCSSFGPKVRLLQRRTFEDDKDKSSSVPAFSSESITSLPLPPSSIPLKDQSSIISFGNPTYNDKDYVGEVIPTTTLRADASTIPGKDHSLETPFPPQQTYDDKPKMESSLFFDKDKTTSVYSLTTSSSAGTSFTAATNDEDKDKDKTTWKSATATHGPSEPGSVIDKDKGQSSVSPLPSGSGHAEPTTTSNADKDKSASESSLLSKQSSQSVSFEESTSQTSRLRTSSTAGRDKDIPMSSAHNLETSSVSSASTTDIALSSPIPSGEGTDKDISATLSLAVSMVTASPSGIRSTMESSISSSSQQDTIPVAYLPFPTLPKMSSFNSSVPPRTSKAPKTSQIISSISKLPSRRSSSTRKTKSSSTRSLTLTSEPPFLNSSSSVVPLWTPTMLGNAYGGGYVTTPSIYITLGPTPSGSIHGIPPGYGSSTLSIGSGPSSGLGKSNPAPPAISSRPPSRTTQSSSPLPSLSIITKGAISSDEEGSTTSTSPGLQSASFSGDKDQSTSVGTPISSSARIPSSSLSIPGTTSKLDNSGIYPFSEPGRPTPSSEPSASGYSRSGTTERETSIGQSGSQGVSLPSDKSLPPSIIDTLATSGSTSSSSVLTGPAPASSSNERPTGLSNVSSPSTSVGSNPAYSGVNSSVQAKDLTSSIIKIPLFSSTVPTAATLAKFSASREAGETLLAGSESKIVSYPTGNRVISSAANPAAVNSGSSKATTLLNISDKIISNGLASFSSPMETGTPTPASLQNPLSVLTGLGSMPGSFVKIGSSTSVLLTYGSLTRPEPTTLGPATASKDVPFSTSDKPFTSTDNKSFASGFRSTISIQSSGAVTSLAPVTKGPESSGVSSATAARPTTGLSELPPSSNYSLSRLTQITDTNASPFPSETTSTCPFVSVSGCPTTTDPCCSYICGAAQVPFSFCSPTDGTGPFQACSRCPIPTPTSTSSMSIILPSPQPSASTVPSGSPTASKSEQGSYSLPVTSNTVGDSASITLSASLVSSTLTCPDQSSFRVNCPATFSPCCAFVCGGKALPFGSSICLRSSGFPPVETCLQCLSSSATDYIATMSKPSNLPASREITGLNSYLSKDSGVLQGLTTGAPSNAQPSNLPEGQTVAQTNSKDLLLSSAATFNNLPSVTLTTPKPEIPSIGPLSGTRVLDGLLTSLKATQSITSSKSTVVDSAALSSINTGSASAVSYKSVGVEGEIASTGPSINAVSNGRSLDSLSNDRPATLAQLLTSLTSGGSLASIVGNVPGGPLSTTASIPIQGGLSNSKSAVSADNALPQSDTQTSVSPVNASRQTAEGSLQTSLKSTSSTDIALGVTSQFPTLSPEGVASNTSLTSSESGQPSAGATFTNGTIPFRPTAPPMQEFTGLATSNQPHYLSFLLFVAALIYLL